MGGWISKQVRYAPHTARRWAANLNGLSPEKAYAPLRRKPELFESLLRDECDAFCRDFLQEVDGYMDSGLPIRRPNSMNNYGLIVNEIGMLNVISELQREVLWPIARSLWPKEGSAFHAHHSFMVQYRKTEDPGLDMHTDDSDVTFNVCLGEVFAGAGLTFCGGVGTPDHRQRAPASVEIVDAPGNPSQSGAPDARCLYTHDRDFAEFRPTRRAEAGALVPAAARATTG
ncbi:procollagen-lysine 5-dioxygenase [Aureococcus anophagefferens]|nr:procollagen-lysine 5-dioxygenase [Aureococcus anophagefferens]